MCHSQCLWLTLDSLWTKSTRGMHRRLSLSKGLGEAMLAHVVTVMVMTYCPVRSLNEKMNQRGKLLRRLMTCCTTTMNSWQRSFRPSTNTIARQTELPARAAAVSHFDSSD